MIPLVIDHGRLIKDLGGHGLDVLRPEPLPSPRESIVVKNDHPEIRRGEGVESIGSDMNLSRQSTLRRTAH